MNSPIERKDTKAPPSLTPGMLRSFDSFSSALNGSRHLIGLKEEQRDTLVRELYTAALIKDSVRSQLSLLPQSTEKLRKSCKRFSELRLLLGRALDDLNNVAESYASELEYAKGLSRRYVVVPDADRELSRSRTELRKITEAVTKVESWHAALIHPGKRNRTEARLAKRAAPRLLRCSFPFWRRDSPKIDHVFLAQVAACLERRVKKLSKNASFFRQVFEAAFGESKEEGSIAKVLQRKPEHKSVFFVEPDQLKPFCDEPSPVMPFDLLMLALSP